MVGGWGQTHITHGSALLWIYLTGGKDQQPQQPQQQHQESHKNKNEQDAAQQRLQTSIQQPKIIILQKPKEKPKISIPILIPNSNTPPTTIKKPSLTSKPIISIKSDNHLPPGWTTELIPRKDNSMRTDKYWFTPHTKKRLRSRLEVERFLSCLLDIIHVHKKENWDEKEQENGAWKMFQKGETVLKLNRRHMQIYQKLLHYTK